MATPTSSPPNIGSRFLGPVLVGLVLGVFVFFLLPISQLISIGLQDDERAADLSVIEPPDLFENPPPPEEEVTEEEIEELDQEQEPPTLEQLEISMTADVSGLAGGDFTVPTYNLGDEIKEMVYELKDLTVMPRAVSQADPQYPPELKRNKVQGEVTLQFLIRANGRTDNIRVESSTNPAFEEAAIRAVRKWIFQPGEKGGEAVTVRVRQKIPFTISN
ncbi:MAG: energy transducer TonB [Opitutales bacterium]